MCRHNFDNTCFLQSVNSGNAVNAVILPQPALNTHMQFCECENENSLFQKITIAMLGYATIYWGRPLMKLRPAVCRARVATVDLFFAIFDFFSYTPCIIHTEAAVQKGDSRRGTGRGRGFFFSWYSVYYSHRGRRRERGFSAGNGTGKGKRMKTSK